MSDEISKAWDTIREAMTNPEYAWSWFCNLSVPISDAIGVSGPDADRAAAHLMHHLWQHDITTHPRYAAGKSNAQAYAELRLAAERAEDEQQANA